MKKQGTGRAAFRFGRRAAALLLSLQLLLTAGFGAEGDGGGAPTAPGGTPVLDSGAAPEVAVSTPAQLAAVAARVNAGDDMDGVTVRLTADLDLSGHLPWVPIGGSEGTPFCGSFQGGGHVISGLSTRRGEDALPGGLFGFLVAAEVSNVTLADADAPYATGGLYFARVRSEVTGCSTYRRGQEAALFSARGPDRPWSGKSPASAANDSYYKAIYLQYVHDSSRNRARNYVVIDGRQDYSFSQSGTDYNISGEDILASISWASSDRYYLLQGLRVYLTGDFDLGGRFDDSTGKALENEWYPIGSASASRRNNYSVDLVDFIGLDCVISGLVSNYGGLVGRAIDGSQLRGITLYKPYINKTKELPYEYKEEALGWTPGGASYSYNGSVGALANQLLLSNISDCAVIGGMVKGPKPGGIVGVSTLELDHVRACAIMSCSVKDTLIESTDTAVGGVGGIAYYMDVTSASRCAVEGATMKGKQIGGIAYQVNGASKQNDATGSASINQCVVLNCSIWSTDAAGSANGLFAKAVSNATLGHNVVSTCVLDARGKLCRLAMATNDAGVGSAADGRPTVSINNFLTDVPYERVTVVQREHPNELHDYISSSYWDGTVAPARAENSEGSPTSQEYARLHYAKSTAQLTSAAFSGLDRAVWSMTDGYYPRIASIQEAARGASSAAANTIAAVVSDLAATPVRLTDGAATWHGAPGIVLPAHAAGGEPIQWTGRFAKLPAGATLARDEVVVIDDLGDIPDLAPLLETARNEYLAAFPGAAEPVRGQLLEWLAGVKEGGRQKYVVVREAYARDGDGNILSWAYYNLQNEVLYTQALTATVKANLGIYPDGNSEATFQKEFVRIALVDSVLQEDLDQSSPARNPAASPLYSADSLEDSQDLVSLTYEDPVEPNPNAGLARMYYTTNAGATWVSAGALDCSKVYTLAPGESIADPGVQSRSEHLFIAPQADGTSRVIFRFFEDSLGLGIISVEGVQYKFEIPQGAVREVSRVTTQVDHGLGQVLDPKVVERNSPSMPAVLYLRTADKQTPVIHDLKNGVIFAQNHAGTVAFTDVNQWMTVEYSGAEYPVLTGGAGAIGAANIRVLTFAEVRELAEKGGYTGLAGPGEIGFHLDAVAEGLRYLDFPAAADKNQPLLYLAFNDSRVSMDSGMGGPLPEPGEYEMYVFARGGEKFTSADGSVDYSTVSAASQAFTFYVEGPRSWNTWLQKAGNPSAFSLLGADNGSVPALGNRHQHLGAYSDLDRFKAVLEGIFSSKYLSTSGEPTVGAVQVDLGPWADGGVWDAAWTEDLERQAWEDGAASGEPWRAMVRVSIKDMHGGRILDDGSPAWAPIYVEVYFDLLNLPQLRTTTLSAAIPQTPAGVRELILNAFTANAPDGPGELVLSGPDGAEFEAMDFTKAGAYLITAKLPKLGATLCPQSTNSLESGHDLFAVNNTRLFQVTLHQPGSGGENRFWDQVIRDIKQTTVGDQVVRRGYWETDMDVDVLEALRQFPYTAMRFSESNFRWTVYGHEITEEVIQNDKGRFAWYLGAEKIKNEAASRLTQGHPAQCVRFEQVGDYYFHVGFDLRVDPSDSGERWYLYALDEDQDKLRYISDALVDGDGWACAVLDRFYDAPYVFTTLPPTSGHVLRDWNRDLPMGIHYGRSQLRTAAPAPEEVFPLREEPFEAAAREPELPRAGTTAALPAQPAGGGQPASGESRGAPWAPIALCAAAALAAAGALILRKQRKGENDHVL